MFRKKFPTPQEFKEIWQPRAWAFNRKMAQQDLEIVLNYIANKLREGKNTIGSDCIDGQRFSRDDIDAALAKHGWKIRKDHGSAYDGIIVSYELLPLDSETPEDPSF